MDITQMQYFKTIAETQSLTKAAQILHISQPAMSTMLKKFEQELNVELFDRSANRIYLNNIGEVALIHVNNILRNVEHMKSDLLSLSQKNLSLSVAFCDPGVQWFCVPRFSLAHTDVNINAELCEDNDISKFLLDRTYDIVITPNKIQHPNIQNVSFLSDKVYLSVPLESTLSNKKSIFLKDIPEQALLYPQIGGYFLTQIEKIISEKNNKVTIVKNEFNITLHLIRTTNFLATVSTLSIELRNDGTHRTLIPVDDPELNITYQISFLKENRQKVSKFLSWAKECVKSTTF